jgi:hypothetical protein
MLNFVLLSICLAWFWRVGFVATCRHNSDQCAKAPEVSQKANILVLSELYGNHSL